MADEARPGVIDIARWAGRSQRLRHRRFALLPLRGPGAVFTEAQGRSPSSSSTAPAELVELISSIAEVGVLQPVLVEETPRPDGPPRLRLVAGERRLRAVLWGAVHLPTNPHCEALPAVVCPGPLTEEEVRLWQLVENLAREDLQPGELAAALLFERCALLTMRLLDAGVPVAETIWRLDDPVQRWAALEALRPTTGPSIGAPWPEVLRRIGVQMSEERAKRLVRALRALPPELSVDMDAHDVALATRLDYLRLLNNGRQAAADDIWAAVKALGRPKLLAAAVDEASDAPDVAAATIVERAQARHDAANEARRLANQPTPGPGRPAPAVGEVADDLEAEDQEVTELLADLRAVIANLRAGHTLSRFDRGSLRLAAQDLLALLPTQQPGLPNETPREPEAAA